MNNKSIAVLMACFNRREVTRSCLSSLMAQSGLAGYSIKVYVLDAGSTDGTVEMIRSTFPDVEIIHRDCSYYWCAGMRVAYAEAMKAGHDYYLWLNDDTKLFPDAICKMLETENRIKRYCDHSIIVGSTCDSGMKERTYGGLAIMKKSRPLSFAPVAPSDTPKPCETLEGNCVLIPANVAKKVGNLSEHFSHSMGDIDYGLVARKRGVSLWLAPGFVGICDENPPSAWTLPAMPLMKRVRSFLGPKGLPIKEWFVFTRRHGGRYWFLYCIKPFFRVLFPRIFM